MAVETQKQSAPDKKVMFKEAKIGLKQATVEYKALMRDAAKKAKDMSRFQKIIDKLAA